MLLVFECLYWRGYLTLEDALCDWSLLGCVVFGWWSSSMGSKRGRVLEILSRNICKCCYLWIGSRSGRNPYKHQPLVKFAHSSCHFLMTVWWTSSTFRSVWLLLFYPISSSPSCDFKMELHNPAFYNSERWRLQLVSTLSLFGCYLFFLLVYSFFLVCEVMHSHFTQHQS